MNIYLIPYTWVRHFQFAWWSSVCGLIVWWFFLLWVTVFGAFWSASWDAYVTCALLVNSVIWAQESGELSLRRQPLKQRVKRLSLAMLIGILSTLLIYWSWSLLSMMFLDNAGKIHHVVGLKYRLGDFISSGLSVSLSLLILQRSFKNGIVYVLGGIFAGLATGAAWSITSYYWFQNLYWAGALMFSSFGFFFGWAVRSIPPDLYVGWVRILNGSRFAHRIPIASSTQEPKERFLGSYPNGLDMYFPYNENVQELHVSIVHSPADGAYILRGLSQQHSKMKRLLEWAVLNYDAKSPQPNQVVLQNEDIIEVGPDITAEFLILPREER